MQDLSKVRDRLIGSEDERAVSPVIGVILMVAITVILAAVIAAFVLDMGDDIGDDAPTTSVDTNVNSSYNDSHGGAMAFMNHETGDAVDRGDLEVLFYDADGSSMGALEIGETGDSDDLDEVEAYMDEDDDEFDGTAQIELVNNDASENPGEFNNSGSFSVELVHTPTDTTLTDSDIELPDN